MEKVDLFVRCYIEPSGGWKSHLIRKDCELPHRVLVIDTETTNDAYQNLLFGDCQIYEGGNLEVEFLFHGNLTSRDIATLESYASSSGAKSLSLMPVQEFIDHHFLPEVFGLETLCIGHNLPFDLSHVARSWGYGRKSNRNGFSFALSENLHYPALTMRHANGKSAFISFNNPIPPNWRNNRNRTARKDPFRGNFLDTHTIAFALTDKSLSLRDAGKRFKAKILKTELDEYGKVTFESIDYCRNDVQATFSLYEAMLGEYSTYNLEVSPQRLHSPASIGKAYLSGMGVTPFMIKNPTFPRRALGYAMESYYGGRSEVRMRKQPTEVVVLDFLSMYPTMAILLNIWPFFIAEKIDVVDDTEGVRDFVDAATIEILSKPATWKELNVLCLIEPNEDILPARCCYASRVTRNIGVNHLTVGLLCYTLSDVVASKLLTGKSPRIVKAIRLLPRGLQTGLKPIQMVGGRRIDPSKDDFFKAMMVYRHELKEQMGKAKGRGDIAEYERLDNMQKTVKTIANSTAYGIGVQIDPQEYGVKELGVYGSKCYRAAIDLDERPGTFFNPLVATLITAGARLVLAITESILEHKGMKYAFCDTDSMAVPPESVGDVQKQFQSLTPYSFEDKLFKVEKQGLFYGISAKRYVIFELVDGKPKIIDCTAHGLGHIIDPFRPPKKDEEPGKALAKRIWHDILDDHYGLADPEDIQDRYEGLYVVSKMAITSTSLMARFKPMNSSAPPEKQIKPFNFMLVGASNATDPRTGMLVKPLAPYDAKAQLASHGPFIDYPTGAIMEGEQYWKTMGDFYEDYKNHPESKFEGDTGVLRRRHLTVANVIRTGKETNRIEETDVLGVEENDYMDIDDASSASDNEDRLRGFILKLSPEEAEKVGISKRQLYRLKSYCRDRQPLKMHRKTLRRIEVLLQLD